MTIDRAADSAAAERMRRAAIEAFAESGYGGSSTRQIAKRLNMSATAMYPHYRSKEELLYAIALEGHSSLLAALKGADDPAASFTERLRAVVAAFAAWHAENHKQARVVQYELHGLTPAHYRTIAPLRHQATDVITGDRGGRRDDGRVRRRQRRRGGDGHLVAVRRRMPVVPVAQAPATRRSSASVRGSRGAAGSPTKPGAGLAR